MEFKDIIKKLRKDKGLTQAALAQEIGVTQGAVTNWEQGTRQPQFEQICAIADIFNVDIDYLLGRQQNRQRIHFDGDGTAMYYLTDDEKMLIQIYKDASTDGRERIKEYARLISDAFKA